MTKMNVWCGQRWRAAGAAAAAAAAGAGMAVSCIDIDQLDDSSPVHSLLFPRYLLP